MGSSMKQLKTRKFISLILIFCLLTNYFFGGLMLVKAAEIRITTDDVWFRSAPTTSDNADGSSNAIAELPMGTKVYLIEDKVNNSSWAKVLYNDIEGYIYRKYLATPGNDAYDRPWNTPKKAIVGGAKWISSGYISRGQFTSYLKKYNVNPNAESKVFNHQYMSNIHAPSSEALMNYKAYQEKNLLSMPLVFNIPIYLNMADKYDSPAGNLATIDYLDTVEDQEFETILDNQGFPESYKRILRYLHKIHPNWTFNGMITNLDFTYAVEVEKNIGATQNSKMYELDANGNKIKTEPGWYLPNFAATAYFMDPRNFLTEKYILQFESLEYSDIYTEDVVQVVLEKTFMNDISSKDNQSYKSIFVEAGKIANVSPVYLASLARQESGVNGSIATTGETFEYEGKTYQSVFNFFNIGAVSSASNPVREGLKYASGGYCLICGDYTPEAIPSEPETKPDIIPASTSLNNLGVKLVNNYVSGFAIGTSIDNLKQKDLNVQYSNDDIIKTGTILTFADGASYKTVILGDLSGDGQINSADILKIRQHLLGTSPLTDAYQAAADINRDNQINSADLLLIRQYLLGQTNINQL